MNENQRIDEEVEIDLLELFYVLLKKWWLIGIVAVLGAVLAMGVTALCIAPKYESKAMLYILNKTTSVTSLADIQIGSALTEDFKVIALSKPVIDGAVEKLKTEENKEFTREDIEDMLTVTNEADTRILTIVATSENPVDACMVANAVSEETATQMANIMKSDTPTTVEAAEVATEPVSPSLFKNTLLGFAAGFVLMCILLIIRYLMNDAIRTEEDVEKYLGVSTLAVIPYIKNKEHKKEELKQQKEESLEQHEKK